MSTQQPNDPVLDITQSILTEAAQRPWLAALLMRRKPDWLTRLAHLAQRVHNLPRHTRRALRRKLASGLAAAALLLALAGTPTAYAVSITVGSGVGGLLTNSNCSLAEAIINANNDAGTWPDCAAGSGADTITLPASTTFSYATALSTDTLSALPDITSQITIEANGSTIQRSGAVTNFRILKVATTSGDLTLNQATLSGGYTIWGGGIHTGGTLTVQNSTITGNYAISRGGGIYINQGTATVQNSTLSSNTAGNGGGVFNSGSTLLVSNSTLSGNEAVGRGGGIASSGTVTVNNSTITNNSAVSGGGLYNNSYFAGKMYVQNSIVAHQAYGYDCVDVPPSALPGYNIESATSCGFTSTGDQQNVTSGALNLQALGPNGTKPHPFTHALGAGSVAIDKIPIGTNGCASTNTDERGGWRANGAGKGGSACDVGAYEADSTIDAATAITLNDLTATANTSPGLIGALGAIFAALGALLFGRRKTAARRRLNY
ncbi:MAG: hypothetical protein KA765_18070 [Thermoflexales bacterium]|nr:hypothetical protein [Thermoflexales bacterium]